MTYKAFLSYSHAGDRTVGAALQSGIQQFAKPFYRLRSCRVFRDQTSLSANPGLWSAIVRALKESEFFILLASREAATSPWIAREIEWWLANRSTHAFLVALTNGEIFWDDQAHDIDWKRTTALPSSLGGRFEEEPLYVDLRWARTETDFSLRNSRFRAAVLDLSATLQGRSKDTLDGEDVRQYRRTRKIAATAIAIIIALGLLATWEGYEARRRAVAANEQAIAATSRQLAIQGLGFVQDRPELAMLLSVSAYRMSPTPDAVKSLYSVKPPTLRRVLYGHDMKINSLAFSRDGAFLASGADDDKAILWDAVEWTPLHVLKMPGADGANGDVDGVQRVGFSRNGTTLGVDAKFVSGLRYEFTHSTIALVYKSEDDEYSNRMTVEREPEDSSDIISGPTKAITEAELQRDTGYTGFVTASALSQDGRLAIGRPDGTILIWDRPISVPTIASAKATFSSTGTYLALVRPQGHLSVFRRSLDRTRSSSRQVSSLIQYEAVALPKFLPAKVDNVAFGRSERMLGVASRHTPLYVVDLEQGVARRTQCPPVSRADPVKAVLFSEDERRVAIISDGAVVCDIVTNSVVTDPSSISEFRAGELGFRFDDCLGCGDGGSVFAEGGGQSAMVQPNFINGFDSKAGKVWRADWCQRCVPRAAAISARWLAVAGCSGPRYGELSECSDGYIQTWFIGDESEFFHSDLVDDRISLESEPPSRELIFANDAMLLSHSGGPTITVVSGKGLDDVAYIRSPIGPIQHMAVLNGGSVLSVLATSGRVWSVSLDAEVVAQDLCETANRKLKEEEWSRYVGQALFPYVGCGATSSIPGNELFSLTSRWTWMRGAMWNLLETVASGMSWSLL